jgi:hypothetical protein
MDWQVGQDVAREDCHGTLLAKEKLTFVGVRKLKTDAGNEYRASDGMTHKDSYSNRIVPWTSAHQEVLDRRRLWHLVRTRLDLLRQVLSVPELEELDGYLDALLHRSRK